MTLLVDTSVLLGSANPVDDLFAVSVISVGELHAGVLLAADDTRRSGRLARLVSVLETVEVLPVDGAVAAAYGRIRASSRRLPANDLWIAATALAHDLVLLTADPRLAAVPEVRTRLV